MTKKQKPQILNDNLAATENLLPTREWACTLQIPEENLAVRSMLKGENEQSTQVMSEC